MKMRFVLFGAILASACQTTQLPAVAVADATADARAVSEVTADDRAVMSAVLDGALRRRTLPDPGTPTEARFLVLDSTVPSCSPEALASGNLILGCFDLEKPLWRLLIEGLTCEQNDQTAGAMLVRRNASSMAIRGKLGEDVALVPADTVYSVRRLSELFLRYPHGGSLVTFSAPVYPKPGVAVVYYRAFESELGFACLVHDQGRWSVRARNNTVE